MSVYIPPISTALTLGYLQSRYPTYTYLTSQLGTKFNSSGGSVSGNLTLSSGNSIILTRADNTNAVNISAAASSVDYSLKLPITAPSANSVIQSDASGNLSFTATPTIGGLLFNDSLNTSVYCASGSIVNTSINTMYTTPIQLIPAYSAGSWIQIISLSINTPANFTGGGLVSIQFGYTGASGGLIIGTIPSANLTTSGTRMCVMLPVQTSFTISGGQNTDVCITNSAAVFAGGSGSTLKWRALYTIVS